MRKLHTYEQEIALWAMRLRSWSVNEKKCWTMKEGDIEDKNEEEENQKLEISKYNRIIN